LILAAILALLAGIQLYILTDYTDQYFAWTIAQPLSATFLGTGYWAGATLLFHRHAGVNHRCTFIRVA
jgi:hypothetical protein